MAGLLASLALACVLAPQDLHLTRVQVHAGTGEEWPDEVVVVDGRIQPPGTRVPADAVALDLGGAHLYPGLQDAHGHLQGLGRALESVDLVGTASYAEVIERVRQKAATLPEGAWVLGRGWDQNDWEQTRFPDHAALTEAVPDHPVLLTRVDGHAVLANARALELAGIDADTEDPDGGEILRRSDGTPTGVLIDHATTLVERHVPDDTDAQIRRELEAAQQACLAVGLTCVHDAGTPLPVLDVLRRMHTRGELRLRVYAMLPASAEAEIVEGPWQTPDAMLTVRAVKAYADGALGSRGAALLEPYSDRPGHRGLLLMQPEALARLAQLCADSRFQLCVHAIGDRANREVLDAYEATRFRGDRAAARFRIEHAQVVAPSDFVRFAELGVIPSMQPTHLTSDMPWAPARLGADRIRGAYAWRHFLDLDLPLPFGSDFPVESPDPRLGLYAAVTTQAPQGGEPMRPEQRLSRQEALAGFTRDAAYAGFLEHDLGTIEAGKRADFTVFDRDLETCPAADILAARVLLTVVDGRVAYRGEEK